MNMQKRTRPIIHPQKEQYFLGGSGHSMLTKAGEIDQSYEDSHAITAQNLVCPVPALS